LGRCLPAVLVAFAAITLPGTALAAPSKCQRLEGRDLAPARSAKLVERPNADDGKDLLGCVLPRGRVHTLAAGSDHYTTVESYSVEQIAGRVVLVGFSHSSQYASTRSLTVHHLRTGRAYRVTSQCSMIGGEDCAPGGSGSSAAAFVTEKGRAVALIQRGGAATVTAFNTLGTPRALEHAPPAAIPAESLHLAGNLAVWTTAGVPRSASIVPG